MLTGRSSPWLGNTGGLWTHQSGKTARDRWRDEFPKRCNPRIPGPQDEGMSAPFLNINTMSCGSPRTKVVLREFLGGYEKE